LTSGTGQFQVTHNADYLYNSIVSLGKSVQLEDAAKFMGHSLFQLQYRKIWSRYSWTEEPWRSESACCARSNFSTDQTLTESRPALTL
jgi:hypothetical protein